MSLTFSFDVGKASLGYCVRKGYEIEELKSLIIPSEHADYVELFGGRKRQFRTREAHEKRQNWLRALWNDLGLEGLDSKDSRLVSEFRKSKDEEVCSGVLLRIKLLEGNKLQEWQIFKALWSAIQKRGYDDKLPWATSNSSGKEKKDELLDEVDSGEKSKPQNDDEAENKKGVESYEKDLVENCGTEEKFQLPSYLEAAKLGLWKNGKIISHKITYEAEKVRKSAFVAPRNLIEKEIEQLLIKAAEQIPSIKEKEFDFVFYPLPPSPLVRGSLKPAPKGITVKGKGMDFILYGEGQKQYASYYKDSEFNCKRGTEWDTQGLLSQKIPRFDNRIIGKCSLIPRLNTCNADDILAQEFKLIQNIRNLIRPNKQVLNHSDFIKVFEDLQGKIQEYQVAKKEGKKDKKPKINYSLSEINKALKRVGQREITEKELHSKQDKKSFFEVNNSGRARFSRPVLAFCNYLLLSGKSTKEILNEILPTESTDKLPTSLFDSKSPEYQNRPCFEYKNKKYYISNDPRWGITPQEIETIFEKRIKGDTWSNYSIQDDREVEDLSQKSLEERKVRVEKELGKITNYVVKNRLQILINTVLKLIGKYGQPDSVVIEMPRGLDPKRDSLDNSTSNQEYIDAQNKRKKKNDMLFNKLKEADLAQSGRLKEELELLEQQENICFYTGQTLNVSDLGTGKYEIDHIIPRSNGGNNSLINKVLVFKEANQDKGNRTPFQYLLSKNENSWEEFQVRINKNKSISKFKKKLLLNELDLNSEDGRKLIDNLNALQDTRFIAKLGKKLIGILLGWNEGAEGSKRKLVVVKGSETAEFRREYGLNKLLGDDKEKNRKNPKHHALDAYCMSFASDEWVWTKSENGKPIRRKKHLETSEHVKKVKAEIKSWMEKVVPRQTNRDKAELLPDETIYGLRWKDIQEKRMFYVVVTRELKSLKQDEKTIRKIWDDSIREDLLKEVNNKSINWVEHLSNYQHPKRKCRVEKVLCWVQESYEAPKYDNQGRVRVGEYCDFGKNSTKDLKNLQLKKTKQNLGQLIYFDEKNTPRVKQIYVFDSVSQAIDELEAKGLEVYRSKPFYSGCLLHIKQDFKAGKTVRAAGIYCLRTIYAKGQVLLENPNGEEILSSVKYLIEADFDHFNK